MLNKAATNKLYTKSDFSRQKVENLSSQDERNEFGRDYARIIHNPAFRRLQGKTQLFPSNENDTFRNRMTHSLEVAQIARGIARALNKDYQYFRKNPISTDLIEMVSLAHDLGHPPFGHDGEKELNRLMHNYGGFESNAQLLRIVSKLEKKVTRNKIENPERDILGLNLTYRSLAGLLKYNREIPLKQKKGGFSFPKDEPTLSKGYYFSERDLVKQIKEYVGRNSNKKFKVIECYIMDLADDIAYSTYDLEDSFKGGFLTPLDCVCFSQKKLHEIKNFLHENGHTFTIQKISTILKETFLDEDLIKKLSDENFLDNMKILKNASDKIAKDSKYRMDFTSRLVKKFMGGIQVERPHNSFSKVKFTKKIEEKILVLKSIAYLSLIKSPDFSIVAKRGKEIINYIFQKLVENPSMLPEDKKKIYDMYDLDYYKYRVISDFVSAMTDRYCVEFYSRLKSTNPQSIFKPL
ncbi:MAG: deoxyguanosinetriphosphate triphosphohydrolase family protein [Candidatus Nanoarchaeia archaeon]